MMAPKSYVMPKARFLFGKNIIAKVTGRIVAVKDTSYSVKMYDAATAKTFTKEEMEKYFVTHEPSEELVKDFDVELLSLSATLKNAGTISKEMNDMIEKAYMDATKSCGNAKSCPIEVYEKLCSDPSRAATLESYKPQFNRRPRNTAVIPPDFNEKVFHKDPLPIGIDAHEFATKAEQNKIFVSLVTQIYGFKGAPPMPDALKTYLGIEKKPEAGSHKCKYCCESMDLGKVVQEYKAKEHYLNLCHDNPALGTRADNLYWGHTSCNRQQGGCSMFERAKQGGELAVRNWATFTEEERLAMKELARQIGAL
jgi:hypothetical protein